MTDVLCHTKQIQTIASPEYIFLSSLYLMQMKLFIKSMHAKQVDAIDLCEKKLNTKCCL